MKITIVSMNFWPEETGTGPVIQGLVDDLAAQGHDVTVVAGFPYYPRRIVPPRYRGKWLVRERYEGIPVYRTWICATDERSALKKILLHLSFTCSCVPALLLAGRPDVLISVSPPLFVPTVVGLLSRVWGCAHILRLEDMLPDAAIIYGLIRSPFLIRVLRLIERLNYRLSDAVVAICEGFARNLRQKREGLGKIAVIPHYVVPPPAPQGRNCFRHEVDVVEGRFLAQYAGNLGHSQGLDAIVDAATLLRDDSRVHFMIVGEGVEREKLVQRAEKANLRNISFLPVQPAEKLHDLLWSADVCLVTQRANVLDINVPSKLFNILAHGRPIIAAVNSGSDAAAIVRDSGAGVLVSPSSPEHLSQAILEMMALDDWGRSRGACGMAYAQEKYSRAQSVRAYQSLLAQLVNEVDPARLATPGGEAGKGQ